MLLFNNLFSQYYWDVPAIHTGIYSFGLLFVLFFFEKVRVVVGGGGGGFIRLLSKTVSLFFLAPSNICYCL